MKLRSLKFGRQRMQVLVACLAVPIVANAAFSADIAKHVGISQMSVLVVNWAVAILLLILANSVRRGNQTS